LHLDHAAHEHGHRHAPKDFGTAFAIAAALNIGLVILQIAYGLLGHSVALLAERAITRAMR
jgi:cobalt-zinc-cadmium efflux system protein